tara:strand:- start:5606 stop:5764 length:159 start_codon:yes stop_codon:yes gene_type:complete
VVKVKSADLVEERMLLKVRKEDVAQHVQPVKITKDEQVKKERKRKEERALLV